MRLHKDSRAMKILKHVALAGGIVLFSFVSPVSGAILVKSLTKSYFKKKYFQKQIFLNDLKNLQQRELMDYKDFGDGRIQIVLTAKGKHETLIYDFDELSIKKSKWDRKWRMIIFDIPHANRRERDAFSKKLYCLGFYRLQKSVFIIPYSCEKEIDFIATVLEIRKYVLILYVSDFEGAEKLRHHFNC